MGKSKRESEANGEGDKESKWDELVSQIEPIANPLASRKMTKKLFKIIKKAQKQKNLYKGVREVQKFIRKGQKGIVIFAGNTNPIEVICHMPVLCEDNGLPYCYVPSKEDLGAASGSKRPTCALMVKSHGEYQELYDELFSDIKALPLPI